MKPIDFKETNGLWGKDQPNYLPLPAFKADTKEGHVVFCMSLSFIERLRILFTGKIWCCLLTFNNALQPSIFTTKKWDLLEKKKK